MKKCLELVAIGCSLYLWSGLVLAQDVGEEAATEPEPRFILNQKTRSLLDHSQRYVTQDEKGNSRLVNSHRHVLLARVGADGKVEMYCADNVHSAQKWAANDAKTEQRP